jgi:tellurite resistance protein TehA-like permease
MKVNKLYLFLTAIVLLATLALAALMPVHVQASAQVLNMPTTIQAMVQVPVPLPADLLNIVIKIMLGFASLVGISALIAALINLLKVIKVVKEGTASQWSAGLNLAAFIALVAFGVFRPDLAMDILDGYAGQIAMVILFILGFLTQITGSSAAHEQLKTAGVPLIGTSFSKNDSA